MNMRFIDAFNGRHSHSLQSGQETKFSASSGQSGFTRAEVASGVSADGKLKLTSADAGEAAGPAADSKAPRPLLSEIKLPQSVAAEFKLPEPSTADKTTVMAVREGLLSHLPASEQKYVRDEFNNTRTQAQMQEAVKVLKVKIAEMQTQTILKLGKNEQVVKGAELKQEAEKAMYYADTLGQMMNARLKGLSAESENELQKCLSKEDSSRFDVSKLNALLENKKIDIVYNNDGSTTTLYPPDTSRSEALRVRRLQRLKNQKEGRGDGPITLGSTAKNNSEVTPPQLLANLFEAHMQAGDGNKGVLFNDTVDTSFFSFDKFFLGDHKEISIVNLRLRERCVGGWTDPETGVPDATAVQLHTDTFLSLYAREQSWTGGQKARNAFEHVTERFVAKCSGAQTLTAMMRELDARQAKLMAELPAEVEKAKLDAITALSEKNRKEGKLLPSPEEQQAVGKAAADKRQAEGARVYYIRRENSGGKGSFNEPVSKEVWEQNPDKQVAPMALPKSEYLLDLLMKDKTKYDNATRVTTVLDELYTDAGKGKATLAEQRAAGGEALNQIYEVAKRGDGYSPMNKAELALDKVKTVMTLGKKGRGDPRHEIMVKSLPTEQLAALVGSCQGNFERQAEIAALTGPGLTTKVTGRWWTQKTHFDVAVASIAKEDPLAFQARCLNGDPDYQKLSGGIDKLMKDSNAYDSKVNHASNHFFVDSHNKALSLDEQVEVFVETAYGQAGKDLARFDQLAAAELKGSGSALSSYEKRLFLAERAYVRAQLDLLQDAKLVHPNLSLAEKQARLQQLKAQDEKELVAALASGSLDLERTKLNQGYAQIAAKPLTQAVIAGADPKTLKDANGDPKSPEEAAKDAVHLRLVNHHAEAVMESQKMMPLEEAKQIDASPDGPAALGQEEILINAMGANPNELKPEELQEVRAIVHETATTVVKEAEVQAATEKLEVAEIKAVQGNQVDQPVVDGPEVMVAQPGGPALNAQNQGGASGGVAGQPAAGGQSEVKQDAQNQGANVPPDNQAGAGGPGLG